MTSPASPRTGDVPRLSGVLDDARRRGFVGRAAQLEAFAASLSGESPVRVHVLHGPGGIGKTTLLDAMARLATDQRARLVYVDARDVPCSADAVLQAMTEGARAARTGPDAGPDVLLVDGYELFAPLDRWFREELLPSRPVGSVTVLAGREAPRPSWVLDPGWRRLVAAHEMDGLDRADSVELLTGLGVAAAAREPLAAMARGHPLALALLAEAAGDGVVPARLSDAPDVVGRLCAMIVDDVPDDAHRTGLATCAHATRMTQDLLVRTVGSRAAEVWGWLESRPYVRRGVVGLFLHDVVRELFDAEFAQRSPDAYAALHVTVRGYFHQRLADPDEPHPDRVAAEILLLHRNGPMSGVMAVLREGGLPTVARAGRQDHEGVLGLIAAGEGPRSAQIARRWLQVQPRGLYRSRSEQGVESFSMQVYLSAADGLSTHDPVAAAVMRAVEVHGPLRPGELVNINRYAGASGPYQRDPMQLLVNGVACILEWGHRPAAWSVITTVDPAYYGPYFEFLGLSPLAGLEVEGHEVVAYGWDRRRLPVSRLFDLLGRRDLSGETGPPPPEMLRPAPLSRDDFAAAVRGALRDVDRPDRLAASPLLSTGVVDAADPDPVVALRATLVAAVAGLGAERRGPEHRRVLERTHLAGAPSQEAAAEVLGLPFSTYRRHLARAHERLVEVLWSVEIGERPAPGAVDGTGPDST